MSPKNYRIMIEFFLKMDDNDKLEFIHDNAEFASYITNPSEFFQEEFFKISPASSVYLQKHSPKTQLMIVERNPHSIQYIKNPTLECQYVALNKDINAIMYLPYAIEEVQIKAILIDPTLIKHFFTPTSKVKKMAIEKDISSIFYIRNPHEEDQLLALAHAKGSNIEDLADYLTRYEHTSTKSLMLLETKTIKYKEKVKKHKNYKNLSSVILNEISQNE